MYKLAVRKQNINFLNNFIMKSKKHKLISVSVDIYQYANGTLIHRYFRLQNGKSYTSEKFIEDGLNKLMLSINPSHLDADITSITIFDNSNIDYIDIDKITKD